MMLLMESRIHGNVYVRFGGRHWETYRRKGGKAPDVEPTESVER